MTDGDWERRIERLEMRSDTQDRRLGKLEVQTSSLLSWQTDQRARHANGPAWVGIIVSAVTSVGAVMVTLYLAGGTP